MTCVIYDTNQGWHDVSRVPVWRTLIQPREVFHAPCLANAVSVILGRNDPSRAPRRQRGTVFSQPEGDSDSIGRNRLGLRPCLGGRFSLCSRLRLAVLGPFSG